MTQSDVVGPPSDDLVDETDITDAPEDDQPEEQEGDEVVYDLDAAAQGGA